MKVRFSLYTGLLNPAEKEDVTLETGDRLKCGKIVMEKDVRSIVVEFNNVAAKIYSTTFNEFADSVRNINRRRDENVFKLQSAKYADTLKHLLEKEVKKILAANDSRGFLKQLNYELPMRIHYYLQEFKHRSNSM